MNYIKNPVRQGVYKAKIHFKSKELLLSFINFQKNCRKKFEELKKKPTIGFYQAGMYEEYLKKEKYENWLLESILDNLFMLLKFNKEGVSKELENEYNKIWQDLETGNSAYCNFGDDNYLLKFNDAFSTEIKQLETKDFIFFIYSIKESTLLSFVNIITLAFGESSFKLIYQINSHVKEDVIFPYISAVFLCLDNKSEFIEDYLINDLEEIKNNYGLGFYRMSILFIGIILEEILARTYENILNEEVPKDAGIGFLIKALFEKKEKKLDIPKDIYSNLYDDARELRNSAVHRGKKDFSRYDVKIMLKGVFRLYLFLKENQVRN